MFAGKPPSQYGNTHKVNNTSRLKPQASSVKHQSQLTKHFSQIHQEYNETKYALPPLPLPNHNPPPRHPPLNPDRPRRNASNNLLRLPLPTHPAKPPRPITAPKTQISPPEQQHPKTIPPASPLHNPRVPPHPHPPLQPAFPPHHRPENLQHPASGSGDQDFSLRRPGFGAGFPGFGEFRAAGAEWCYSRGEGEEVGGVVLGCE